MRKLFFLFIPIIIVAFIFSCNRKSTAQSNDRKKTATLTTLQKNGITLTELFSVEQFENATLTEELGASATDLDSNKFTLNFTATNYEFGKQTDLTGLKTCANAVKGQHVHVIVDNEPYTAVYTNKGDLKTKGDGQHTVLSFLSRSYHESIKNKNAYVLSSVITGKSRYYARYAAPDLTSPMLFFSRPKGEYTGAETDAVLLDFYLVNCDLSKDGYKVKAEINGTEFIITKWCGYFMEGLPIGENTVKLTLLDKDNKKVESPYNESERKFTLKK
ncbi:MAG: hypothetical protein U0U67_02530 [Chitinophagales bacterium]